MYETETIEHALGQALGRVRAPKELWARIEQARAPRPRLRIRRLSWALAAAFSFAAIAWNLPRPEFQSEDPGQIRAWVKERTGLDIPFAAHPASAHLTGARLKRNGVEIAYTAGGTRATLAVSRASGAEATHWSSRGISYALVCGDLACRLCHAGDEWN